MLTPPIILNALEEKIKSQQLVEKYFPDHTLTVDRIFNFHQHTASGLFDIRSQHQQQWQISCRLAIVDPAEPLAIQGQMTQIQEGISEDIFILLGPDVVLADEVTRIALIFENFYQKLTKSSDTPVVPAAVSKKSPAPQAAKPTAKKTARSVSV